MTNIDSSYDRTTSESRRADPGRALYALIQDHNGPCSVVDWYANLDDAIAAAREIDTDSAPTDLETDINVDASGRSVAWLVERAEEEGWRVVASAPAGEHWTVLVAEPADPTITLSFEQDDDDDDGNTDFAVTMTIDRLTVTGGVTMAVDKINGGGLVPVGDGLDCWISASLLALLRALPGGDRGKLGRALIDALAHRQDGTVRS